MREQSEKVQTGAMRKVLLIAATLLMIAGAVFATSAFVKKRSYTPPEYEAAALAGVPSPAENMAYSEVNAENGITFWLASTLYQQEDGSLLVYLTNPQSSRCVISCEIKNEAGDTLYKSGALRSGEYVERLQPQMKIDNVATPIIMFVYAFEPDTWYSVGEVQLSNTLQPH